MIHQNTDVFIDTTLLPYYDETMTPEMINIIFMELPRLGENVDLKAILFQSNFSTTEGLERLYQYLNKSAIPYVKTVVHSFERGRQQIILGLSL